MLPEIANFSTLAIPNPNHSPISHKNKNFGMSSNWIPQQTPDGKEFWFNPSSGQSTFTNPFERDFKEMKTPDGRSFWFNSNNNQTVWENPYGVGDTLSCTVNSGLNTTGNQARSSLPPPLPSRSSNSNRPSNIVNLIVNNEQPTQSFLDLAQDIFNCLTRNDPPPRDSINLSKMVIFEGRNLNYAQESANAVALANGYYDLNHSWFSIYGWEAVKAPVKKNAGFFNAMMDLAKPPEWELTLRGFTSYLVTICLENPEGLFRCISDIRPQLGRDWSCLVRESVPLIPYQPVVDQNKQLLNAASQRFESNAEREIAKAQHAQRMSTKAMAQSHAIGDSAFGGGVCQRCRKSWCTCNDPF